MLRTLTFVLSILAAGSANSRADWPEFRGPTAQGIADRSQPNKAPLVWSNTEHIRWRTELPGLGWSSPIEIAAKVYLTAAIPVSATQDPPDLDLALLVVDARSGSLLKTINLFRQSGKNAAKIHLKNSHASPTPVFDRDRIYVHFGHQGTACVSTAGDVVWRNGALAYPPVHGSGCSPIVVDDLLIFSRDSGELGEVLALETATGDVRWRTPRAVKADKTFSFCTALLINVQGRRQVIVPGSNVVQSLDPATGKELWRVRYDGYSVIPRPIFEEGLVFVCTGYNKPSLLAIRPDGSGDVTDTHVAWRTDQNIPHTPSLIARDGLITMVTDKYGIATCVEAKTGKEVWRERIGGNFSASPLLVGDRIYFLSEEGETTVIAAGKQFQELGRNRMGERALASMAVVDDDFLLRTAAALYRISL